VLLAKLAGSGSLDLRGSPRRQQRNTPVASSTEPQDPKDMFTRVIDEPRQAVGRQEMSQQQKDEMFAQFRRWQASQAH
jgi:hypothetical protein